MDEQKKLWALGLIHGEKDALDPKRVLEADFRDIKAVKKQIEDAENRLKTAKERQAHTLGLIGAAEADMSGREQFLSQGKARLYEAKGRSLKELMGIQRAVLVAEQELQAGEDAYGELLEQLERLKAEAGGIEDALKALKKRYNQMARDFNAKKSSLELQINALDVKEEGVRSALPEDILNLYDSVVRRVGKTPVATIRSQVCQGCHIGISDQQIRKIRFGQQLHCCENCGRILIDAAHVQENP
jgi:predicted  nucleic acid-binding Zn-ribbon protein